MLLRCLASRVWSLEFIKLNLLKCLVSVSSRQMRKRVGVQLGPALTLFSSRENELLRSLGNEGKNALET